MDKETFAERLALSEASTAKGLLAGAQNPVGRGVSAQRKALAAWLAGLDDQSRTWLLQMVEEGVHAGAFGVLCVLDHVRFLEDRGEKGTFTLTYTAPSGEQTQLNPDSGEMLHDLYNWYSRDKPK